MNLIKKGIAECLGTFTLVLIACGVAAATGGSLVATALSFGIALIAMAYSIGRISGCHINPAVSIGVFLKDKLNKTPADKAFGWKELLVYIGAQLIGGILGGITIFGIAKMANVTLVGDACNYAIGQYDAGGIIGALLLEIILTFLFVYVILNVTDSKFPAPNAAGALIGLTLTGVHLLGINFTGTSVNPARSLATAIATAIFNGETEALKEVWIFIAAPIAGACLTAVVYHFLHKDAAKDNAEIQK